MLIGVPGAARALHTSVAGPRRGDPIRGYQLGNPARAEDEVAEML